MLLDVVFINESTVISDEALAPIISTLQHQVWNDFRPTWGVTAMLSQVPKGQAPPPNKFWVGIFDTSDQAGALGYHDLTPQGLAIGKVFAKTDIEYGAQTSVTCSHELLEMLGDRSINLKATDSRRNRDYAYENCDAVEADDLGYKINGITVSDFVLPEYFEPQSTGPGKRLSLQNHIAEPFGLAPGGYLSYVDLNNPMAGWQQETAETIAPETPLGHRQGGFPVGSRRERRIRAGKGELVVSDVTLVGAPAA